MRRSTRVQRTRDAGARVERAASQVGRLRRSGDRPARSRGARAAALAVGAVVASLLLTGCGPINAGSAAAERFEQAVRADYDEWVEGFNLSEHNTLPFAGSANGSVLLRAETPPEVFDAVLAFVEQYPDDRFEASGVQANGIGVCIGDGARDAKHELRAALHAAGGALQGEWRCPPRPGDPDVGYHGDMAAFAADLALLQSAATGLGGALTLQGSVTDPDGSVSVPLDALPASAPAALEAIAATAEIVRFELVDAQLTVAIVPTADPAPVQAAADAAASEGLTVQVVLGSLDPSEQATYAELAPLLDELRALPGVDGVEARTLEVTLRTNDAAGVQALGETVLARAEFTGPQAGLSLRIELGEGERPSTYWHPADASSDHLARFAALVQRDDVTAVTLHEAPGNGNAWLSVRVTGTLADAAAVKPELPVGVPVQLYGETNRNAARFTVADQLTLDDLGSVRDEADGQAFLDAWNAIP